MAEKAQHTGVCEHFEDIFSSNMEQKWALMGFNAIAMWVSQGYVGSLTVAV
jgi:hypothetical protein